MSQPQDYNFSSILWNDDGSPSIVYRGLWSKISRTEAWFASLHSTAQVGASATFSFLGPAYIFFNISLPRCENKDGFFMLRAYVHGWEVNRDVVSVACAGTGSVDHLGFYSNFVNASGTQNATIELVEGGDAIPINGGPLLLDSYGILPLDSVTLLSPTVAANPLQISDSASAPSSPLGVPTTSGGNITLLPTTNAYHRPIFSLATMIAICLALFVGFVSTFALYLWRRRIWNFAQKRMLHSSNSSEVNMTESLNRSLTPNAPRYSTLGYYLPMRQGVHMRLGSESTLERNMSPNSLFDDAHSTSTANFTCILGENAKHGECFCPACDETRSNRIRQSTASPTENRQTSGRPVSSGAQSHAQSSITAVGMDAGYSSNRTSSATAASVNTDPFADNHAPASSIKGNAP